MSSKTIKPLAGLLGAALLTGAVSTHVNAGTLNPFVADELQSGYNLANFDKHEGEGKCGEGKCGEGKAGAEGMHGEGKAQAEGKPAEGKCGEGKCGEGKCGENMDDADAAADTQTDTSAE
jgi:uncharacterized low-complexity protein